MNPYSCTYRQLFNEFGAPGIPNRYEATLSHNNEVVARRRFWWRRRAEKQCVQWGHMFGAAVRAPR